MLALKKILKLSNIGRFQSISPSGASTEFLKLTLVYGGNGSGKTTLTSILRSLQLGQSKHIEQRRMLTTASSQTCEVSMRITDSTGDRNIAYATDKGWKELPRPEIRIFDSLFVHENIHSGEAVFKEQRESLFLLLFVDASTRALSDEIRLAQKTIRRIASNEKEVLEKIEVSIRKKLKIPVDASVRYKDRGEFQSNLKKKEFRKALWEHDAGELVTTYEALMKSRENEIKKLGEVKRRIISSAEISISTHQPRVNNYLRKLGAAFEISEIEPSNFSESQWPRIKYAITVNGVAYRVFDSNTVVPGEPSFNTILSEADKRTLSLAFFLSTLDADPLLNERVVVLDDPMSSYDSARRAATKDLVVSLAPRVGQLIVLSHDEIFLAQVAKSSRGSVFSAIELKKRGSATEFKEWDWDRALRPQATDLYFLLSTYKASQTGDELQVATAIRNLLEENYRFRFPLDFSAKDWLGDFLASIRASGGIGRLAAVFQHLDELSEINAYASLFHHAGAPKIDPTELHGYVRRTLDLLHN